ncbi:MAG: lipopolysaccharide biosynthesis protein [Thermocladium sp.]
MSAKPKSESAVMGIFFNYANTLVNYGFAVIYVIVLTRFVPITQYGYYNAIIAFTGIISLFFPSFGVDNAIAKEAAEAHAKGGDVNPYYSAMMALTITITMASSITLIAAIPLLKIPASLIPILYIIISTNLLNTIANSMGFYLWLTQRTATQGKGMTMGSLVYRVSEIALIIIMRNVYAIAIANLLNVVTALAYYAYNVRIIPSIRLGLIVLKRRIMQFLNSGFQFWLAWYINNMGSNALNYMVYLYLGPQYSALFGISTLMMSAVSNFSQAVGNVFGSTAAHSRSLGGDVGRTAMEYSIAAIAVAGVLSIAAIAMLPLLPIIHVLNGDYAAALPYAALLFGLSPLTALDGVYMMYYWIMGRGWSAVQRAAAGVVTSIILFVAMVGSMGLYAAVLASYMGFLATAILYWLNNRPWSPRMWLMLTASTLLPTISALIYAMHPIYWPLPQLITAIILVLLLLIVKPLPKSTVGQVPPLLRRVITWFTR